MRIAIKTAGGLRPLGRLLDISYQSIQQWRRVPAERVLEVERVTGVPRQVLRPELYRPAKVGAAPVSEARSRPAARSSVR